MDFEIELSKQGYMVKTSTPKFKRNEVLIAVKEHRDFSDIDIDTTNLDGSLDLLSLRFTYEEKKLCIIGVKVLVGNGNKEDYQNRGRQIQALNGYVNDIKSKFEHGKKGSVYYTLLHWNANLYMVVESVY